MDDHPTTLTSRLLSAPSPSMVIGSHSFVENPDENCTDVKHLSDTWCHWNQARLSVNSQLALKS